MVGRRLVRRRLVMRRLVMRRLVPHAFAWWRAQGGAEVRLASALRATKQDQPRASEVATKQRSARKQRGSWRARSGAAAAAAATAAAATAAATGGRAKGLLGRLELHCHATRVPHVLRPHPI